MRAKQDLAKWKKRALAHAKTLQGRERTEREKKVASNPDPWHYFMVYGIQPETQAYIDKTIDLIQKCSNYAERVRCEIRLNWTHEELNKKGQKE